MNQKQITAIREYVLQLFHEDSTGHDFYHMERVAKLAVQIAIEENADQLICEAAAWLHDVGDTKLFNNSQQAIEEMHIFLNSIAITPAQISKIDRIIHGVSFRKGVKVRDTLEGKIVQDADRLDAIGAIGIARTFAYGGSSNQLIYSPNIDSTSIQHFYDKLLKLKDLMHTDTARKIAVERHMFMENFLRQFYQEWN